MKKNILLSVMFLLLVTLNTYFLKILFFSKKSFLKENINLSSKEDVILINETNYQLIINKKDVLTYIKDVGFWKNINFLETITDNKIVNNQQIIVEITNKRKSETKYFFSQIYSENNQNKPIFSIGLTNNKGVLQQHL